MTGVETDQRVLVLAPTRRDAEMSRELMRASGIPMEFCASLEDLSRRLRVGAAAIVVPEEAVLAPAGDVLVETLRTQAPWSDLPVLILTRPGAESVGLDEAAQRLGNVMLLERPLRVSTLTSALRSAVRARLRQYQIRAHLTERARAEVALRVADQRKDEFLATLSHELRNPLAALSTALELLKRSDIEGVPRRAAEVMERQCAHLTRLVDDLMEVSRITRGVIDVRRAPVDLGTALRAAVDTSRPALEAAQHALAVSVPDEPLIVSGDVVRLTQVFANLLTNAAKYTPPGGHVWLTATREATSVRITVRDDGIGLHKADLPVVFDMFTQVDRSTRLTQGGLGIGLTLVRSLVQMHGGTVEARSAGLGKGSEFLVELPLLVDVPLASTHQAPLERLPECRVLVVDDNGDAAQSLAALLGGLGAETRVAYSGHAALVAVTQFAPDVVIMDIGMPGMNGYEVARRIRSDHEQQHTLLIALTGWGQSEDCRQAQEAGFDHHMVKPPDLARLHAWLSQRRAQPARSAAG